MSLDVDEMPKWLALGNNYAQNVIAGINDDDCAVVKIGKEQVVITTDYINANPIALELKIGSYWDIGRLLVCVNLSDLCGTGALPKAFLTAIMLDKGKSTADDYKALMMGVRYELDKWGIPLVGGDSKLGNANNFCGIAIGYKQKKSKLFLKSTAVLGDDIWVSGCLGSVAAAVEGLKSQSMGRKWNLWAKKSILAPNLPLKKSKKLAKSKYANGGTDVSDGLGADLWNVCESSNLGAVIDVDLIPVSKQVVDLATSKGIAPWIYSMTIGGDCQFLFTAPVKFSKEIQKMGFIKIGGVTEGKEAYIKINDRRFTLPKIGHRDINTESFSKEVDILIKNISSHIVNK